MQQRRYWDERIETMSRDDLEQLQSGRLQWQVIRDYHGSEFYRERLNRAGVDPEQIASLEDVRRLPILTREELVQEQRLHPPFGRLVVAPRENWRGLDSRSRPPDEPGFVVWSEADIANLSSLAARCLWQLGARPGDVLFCGSSDRPAGVASAALHGAERLGCAVMPAYGSVSEQHVDFLRSTGAAGLVSTPSLALELAEALRLRGISAGEARLGLCAVEAVENVPTREEIESALGLATLGCYGLVEPETTVAAECEARAGLHWPEDHVLLEVLHPDTQEPVPAGDPGILVFTHLTRQGTPLLRFWSGAMARRDTSRCACGRTHARTPGGITYPTAARAPTDGLSQ